MYLSGVPRCIRLGCRVYRYAVIIWHVRTCSVLQCVAVCCSVLVSSNLEENSVSQWRINRFHNYKCATLATMWMCVAVCCTMCVAVCCSVLHNYKCATLATMRITAGWQRFIGSMNCRVSFGKMLCNYRALFPNKT